MKTVSNTKKEASDNPMLVLMDAMMMGSHGAVERSELRGQGELVESDVIPTSWGHADKKEGEAKLEAMGFVLGESVGDDPMFRYAQLPTGWKKVATDHAMWSHIVDDAGEERCAIFYKAAFYDRSAFIRITG